MGNMKFFQSMIDDAILDINTAYVAKVLSTNGTTAKIQPLGKVKAYGEKAKTQSPLTSVPVIQSARYKFTTTTLYGETVARLSPLTAGDIVLVVCCDRDITEAQKGVNSTPVIGHHSKSDSVIVGIL